ncbi:putative outer membrane starch-binding protein [Mucilaginibacter frigoritolerans]|uniref:Putative outer membrane starch-binding protein n=2 Tax=Mucilaginibacter frigoritolerans TaxID=652788 RepID=A0A562TYL0_9SPHI|nr:putative outer membrane starch-binding protein [Mucilaginibacter frigoritolerans]
MNILNISDMKISKYIIMLMIISMISVLYSCKKSFLETPQTGTLSPELLQTKAGVDGLLVGAYSALRGVQADGTAFGGGDSWQTSPDNWIYGGVAGGDAHKGSNSGDQSPIEAIASFYPNATNPFFNSKWIADYEGITRCNNTIKAAVKTPGYSASDLSNILGQARFLRAHYYFDLKKMFNYVPYIDENTTDVVQPNTADIWPKIEADFQYAYANLPPTQTDVGRANKWAAGAYLGKTYMYEHKYSDAKAVFDDVITIGVTSGGLAYALVPKFHDNFNADTKNNSESIFAIQALANSDPGGITQANDGDRLNYPYGANSPFDCCSFYQPSIDLANHYRTNPATGLPYLDDFDTHAIKTDMGYQSSDSTFVPDAGTIDPRLDWTVGRRGIPYLDWGLHPGNDWIRDQTFSGPYSPIKHVYTQAEQNTNGDQHSWGPGTAVNYNIIRFADVILLAAEAEAQLGNLTKAETYVNMVRNRAANPGGFVYQYLDNSNPTNGYSTTPAANYLVNPYPDGDFNSQGLTYALKAIYYERQLELAMEGHRFFDLVRWGVADQALNAYFLYEGKLTTDITQGHFTKGRNEYYPIPQTQIDLEVKGGKSVLKQNPGYN